MKILEDKNQREALVFIASVFAMAIIISSYFANLAGVQERNRVVTTCNKLIAENNAAYLKELTQYRYSFFNNSTAYQLNITGYR